KPFEHDHLAVDHIDSGLQQPGKREPPARFGTRSNGIGDHEGLEALLLKIDGGLGNANVSLDAAHYHLRPAFAAKLMQPLAQRVALQARKLDLVDDYTGAAESLGQRSQ